MPREQIDTIKLRSESDFCSAKLYAQAYEIAGYYADAKRLYERMLARRKEVSANDRIYDSINRDLDRVAAWRSASEHSIYRKYAEASKDCRVIVLNIKDSDAIDLKTKLTMMNKICSKTISGLTPHDSVRLLAVGLRDSYRKESQCLHMAEDLNKQAYKLERASMYPMAEKLYKDALSIKAQNLGPMDPETLAQYGDLARLKAEQGHVSEASAIYKKTLDLLRKIPDKSESYSIMLQNYGDMLSHAHQQQKAEKVYDEARAFYASSQNDASNLH